MRQANTPAGGSHPGDKNPGTPSRARVSAARRAPLRRTYIRRKSGGWKTVRPDVLRDLWSQVVRTRDGFRCRRCPRAKEFGDQIQGAHVLSVGAHANLKFVVENGIALCARCHDWFDTHRGSNHDGEAENWVKSVIGIDQYTKLLVLAKTMYRPSKTMIKIVLREELRRVKDGQA